ncbi:hypothetical protein PHAVU_001G234900 [Phaseolus vulgaris]|uniref:Uncharacterized protein n=1 Tax=Phaseolus vulgaris TaxID=3885 RepID=V7D2I4_PHAVU|nr:hypothetical protein PHAVU_001G234900g [Phaseolus vulgaris]ESW35436.1 hypothetical protein PHAVU_001G234900g [Phaseolus vulgaris]
MANPEGSAEAQDGHLREPLRESGENLIKQVASAFNGKLNILVRQGSGAIYAANKAAINQLSKYLAFEWNNIRSNNVAPWLLANKELLDKIICRTPMKRIAEAHEVSSLVTFLCYAASSFLHHCTSYFC